MEDLKKAKVIYSVAGERFLLTKTRLYEPVASRGRYSRTPFRWVSLSALRKATRAGVGVKVPCHGYCRGILRGSYIVNFAVVNGPGYTVAGFYRMAREISIGCKVFAGGNAAAIRKAAKL